VFSNPLTLISAWLVLFLPPRSLFGIVLVIIDITLVFVRMDKLKWKLRAEAPDPKVNLYQPSVARFVYPTCRLNLNSTLLPKGYEIVSTSIVVYFMVELCLRIFAIG
jgi:hypothetical protein